MKSFAYLLLLTASTPALAAGQLPRTVLPVGYDITVKPDAKAMRFSGSETIAIDVTAPTRTITLNAANLEVKTATVDGIAGAVTLNARDQQLTVTLPTMLKTGRHSLAFAWAGTINRAASGLFAIDYTNADGSKAQMLATQFEAPDARRFAPMWDEPAFKATFKLTAVAPKGQLAFSNMPTAAVSADAAGLQTYRFGETPRMSSYLLFLGIGDFERKTVMAGKTEIGVITRRGVVDQGDYALASAKRLLAYYNDYFGQPYPLPKLDMIAGPGSSEFFGAMENWGAIFYFENDVLLDPARAATSNRQRIYTVVAHEMAHQWFGDLVTMAWWDDLWLNEGFASWMENKASGDLNPSWQARADAVESDREKALELDATAATHPIVRHLKTVDDIGGAFDTITYQKGQAVIGMLESTLGPDVFRQGIRSYMAKYRYGNTATAQLWAELAAAAGKPVAGIADDFTLQGGVPLVTLTGARCVNGQTQATLVQGRFGVDAPSKAPQTWHVPLQLAVLGSPATSAIVTGAAPSVVTVAGCGTLVLNRGKGSYLRTLYDDAGHAAIVRDFAKLDLDDQIGTLGDDFALARSGDAALARYLELQGRVSAEASPLLWSMISDQMGALIDLFRGTPLEAPLRARAVARLDPVLQRIGFVAAPGESPLVANLRETLIKRLGGSGDAAVVAQARMRVAALVRGQALPPAIRQAIVETYVTNATPAEWEALLGLMRAETNPVARNGYAQLLGTVRDPALAARALELVKGEMLSTPQKASMIKNAAKVHPDLVFDFAAANADLVNGFVEESSRAGYIFALAQTSNDPAMPAKVAAYGRVARQTGDGERKVTATLAGRRQVAARLRGDVAAWVAR